MVSLISLGRGGLVIANDCCKALPCSLSRKKLTLLKIQILYFNSRIQPEGKKAKTLTLYTLISFYFASGKVCAKTCACCQLLK